jgi:hypothetical protein
MRRSAALASSSRSIPSFFDFAIGERARLLSLGSIVTSNVDKYFSVVKSKT